MLEANETAAKHEQAKELLALRDAAIVDLQKRIAGACCSMLTNWVGR